MELQLKDVTKKYGEKVALDRFSLYLPPGNLRNPGRQRREEKHHDEPHHRQSSSGRREIHLRRHGHPKAGHRIPAHPGLHDPAAGTFEGMTAESFLIYMARLKEIPRKQTLSEIDRVLEMTNLQDVRHKKVGAFSGGMKQRVAPGSSPAGRPKVLILDEAPPPVWIPGNGPAPGPHLPAGPGPDRSAGHPHRQRH